MSDTRGVDGPPPGGPGPADQATVRRTNLGLVLRLLRAAGPRSRARIAQDTGLNKATVSSLVAELMSRGLVTEGELERDGAVGRPGLSVGLAGRGACGIGVELNVDYLACLVLDLRGEVLVERRVPHDAPAMGPERTLDELAGLVEEAVAAVTAAGAVLVGLSIAVPGLVDSSAGVVTLAPNIGWRDVAVVQELRARLPGGADFPVRAENDANLSAIAEWAMGSEAHTPDLVYLTGEVGVGGGVIIGGRLLRGASGFTGEVGHVPLGDPEELCGCGRRGCWETAVGLARLLDDAADADDPVRDPERDLVARLAEIERRAVAGDQRTLAALHRVGVSLGTGAALLINVFNPEVVVLGGYFAVLGRFLVDPMTEELRSRVFGPGLAGARVVCSRLGFTAAVRGGAHVALESVFADPTVVPVPVGRPPSTGRPPEETHP